jgi:hypothetical protein
MTLYVERFLSFTFFCEKELYGAKINDQWLKEKFKGIASAIGKLENELKVLLIKEDVHILDMEKLENELAGIFKF